MKTLEEEIQQEKFASEFQKLVLNITVTSNAIQVNMKRFLKQYSLSPEQYNVLRILRGQKGKPVGILPIQDRMLEKMSNASRLVDKLELKKLVTRKQCPSDRRQVEVLITQKGLDLLSVIDKNMEHVNKTPKILEGIPLEDFQHLLDLVRTYFNQEKQ